MKIEVDWRPSPSQVAELVANWSSSDQALFFVRLAEQQAEWEKTRGDNPMPRGWQWYGAAIEAKQLTKDSPEIADHLRLIFENLREGGPE